MGTVKITVVRGFSKEEIFGDDVPEELRDFEAPCKTHYPGQEYVIEGTECPEGFCTWAFRDIYRDIVHLTRGGDFPWVGKLGVMYSSCTDGRKTVVFKLERIE
jgi:uncharacterized repeat protein (TIGR04076 family)